MMSPSLLNATVTLTSGRSISTNTAASLPADPGTQIGADIPCQFEMTSTGTVLRGPDGREVGAVSAVIRMYVSDITSTYPHGIPLVPHDSRASVSVNGGTAIEYLTSGDSRDMGGLGQAVEVDLMRVAM